MAGGKTETDSCPFFGPVFFFSSEDVDVQSFVKAVAARALIGTFGMFRANYRTSACVRYNERTLGPINPVTGQTKLSHTCNWC